MITVPLLEKETRNVRTIITKANGWLAREDFELFLERELCRTERNHSTSYCIVIDFSNHYKYQGLICKDKYPRFLTHIVDLINHNTRFVDIKCLSEDYRISILLEDTSLEGAQVFLEKIRNKFRDYFAARQKLEYLILLRHLIFSITSMDSRKVYQQVVGMPASSKGNGENGGGLPGFNDYSSIESNTVCDSKTILEEKDNFYFNWNLYSAAEEPEHIHASLARNENSNHSPHFFYSSAKRIFDFCAAAIGIILFLPLMILIALAIKTTSKGPVLFKQKRVGYRGQLFTFLKFRTMYSENTDQIHREYIKKLIEGNNGEINQGSAEEPLYKLKDDPRVTKIGHFLRCSSLDELPQFFNVFTGSMSMVGPRPPIPYEVDLYQPWHLRRITMAKPGITGLWQVYGRNKTTFDDMVRLDLQYIRNRSLRLDTIIVFKTVFVMFNKKFGL